MIKFSGFSPRYIPKYILAHVHEEIGLRHVS